MPRPIPAIILLAAALGVVDTAAPQTPVHASFTVRNAHALAYDSRHQRTVLFGGADDSRVLSDTWVWAPAERRWRAVPVAGPDARTFPAMTFDSRREAVVLFGGNRVLFGRDPAADTFLGDTWLLRGEHWTQLQVSGPSTRAEAAVAYDAGRGVVVLFGGYRRRAGEMERLGDTWEWDGGRWTHVASAGPSPRNGAVMAYHQQRGRVLLFGGRGASNETWEWDGHRWTLVAAGDVPGRFNAAMAYDARRHALVRFGGWTGSTRTADTWLFTLGRWQQADVAGPDPRNHAAMAYDHNRGVTVIVGGHDGERVYGDTWEWDGRRWTLRAGAPPRRRVDNGH